MRILKGENMMNKQGKSNSFFGFLLSVGICLFTGSAFATDMGNMASAVTGTFSNVTKLITGGSYIAGLGFSVASIMKFKQHKDNPTQIPVGTPVALVFIAAAFLFLPSILSVAGWTMFGATPQTSGPSGSVFGKGGLK